MIQKHVKESLLFKTVEEKTIFEVSQKKIIHNIDTLYLSVFLKEDKEENPKIKKMINELHDLKTELLKSRMEKDVYINDDLKVTLRGVKMYVHHLQHNESFDIFIADSLVNERTNRIQIQIRSYALWTLGIKNCLYDVYDKIVIYLNRYGLEIMNIKENRIDYCYHTNYFESAEKYFSIENLSKCMLTSLEFYQKAGDIKKLNDLNIYYMHKAKDKIIELKRFKDNKIIDFEDDYLALGRRKSNSIFIRIYDKTKEVVQMGYKSFFLEYWLQKKMISAYDKFCYEYAYLKKDFDYIYKGRLQFFADHSKDKINVCRVKKLLDLKNANVKMYQELAEELTPNLTQVINVEFETKSKFYYYSNDQINALMTKEYIQELKRVVKVIDYAKLFTDYITKKTLVLLKPNAVGFEDYSDFWVRLRRKKLEGSNEVDEDLIREYSLNIDKKLLKQRLVAAVSSNSAINEIEKGQKFSFAEDVMNILSNLNDNDKTKLRILSEHGELVEDIRSNYLQEYEQKKHKSKKRYEYKIKKVEEKKKAVEEKKKAIKNNKSDSGRKDS